MSFHENRNPSGGPHTRIYLYVEPGVFYTRSVPRCGPPAEIAAPTRIVWPQADSKSAQTQKRRGYITCAPRRLLLRAPPLYFLAFRRCRHPVTRAIMKLFTSDPAMLCSATEKFPSVISRFVIFVRLLTRAAKLALGASSPKSACSGSANPSHKSWATHHDTDSTLIHAAMAAKNDLAEALIHQLDGEDVFWIDNTMFVDDALHAAFVPCLQDLFALAESVLHADKEWVAPIAVRNARGLKRLQRAPAPRSPAEESDLLPLDVCLAEELDWLELFSDVGSTLQCMPILEHQDLDQTHSDDNVAEDTHVNVSEHGCVSATTAEPCEPLPEPLEPEEATTRESLTNVLGESLTESMIQLLADSLTEASFGPMSGTLTDSGLETVPESAPDDASSTMLDSTIKDEETRDIFAQQSYSSAQSCSSDFEDQLADDLAGASEFDDAKSTIALETAPAPQTAPNTVEECARESSVFSFVRGEESLACKYKKSARGSCADAETRLKPADDDDSDSSSGATFKLSLTTSSRAVTRGECVVNVNSLESELERTQSCMGSSVGLAQLLTLSPSVGLVEKPWFTPKEMSVLPKTAPNSARFMDLHKRKRLKRSHPKRIKNRR